MTGEAKKTFMLELESPDLRRLRRWHAVRVRNMTRTADSLEDVEQEIVLFCYQAYCRSFDPSRGGLRPFLKHNFRKFVDHYLRKSFAAKRLAEEVEFDECFHGSTVDDPDIRMIEERVSERLPDSVKVVFTLVRLGWSRNEIAERIGRSRLTVWRMVKDVIKPIMEEELCRS